VIGGIAVIVKGAEKGDPVSPGRDATRLMLYEHGGDEGQSVPTVVRFPAVSTEKLPAFVPVRLQVPPKAGRAGKSVAIPFPTVVPGEAPAVKLAFVSATPTME